MPEQAEGTLEVAVTGEGFGFTVKVNAVDVAVQGPELVTVTVYAVVDPGLTEMLCVVAPVLQSQEVPFPPFSVSVTAGSFPHFEEGPEIFAIVEGLTVTVIILE